MKTIEDRQAELDIFHDELFGQKNNIIKINTNINSQNADIERFKKSFKFKNGAKIEKLWNGDFSDYPSQSEADLAFCRHLSWFFQKNASIIDSIFRSSGLYRHKWDEPHSADGLTYGQMTIGKAVALTSKTYNNTKSKNNADSIDNLDSQTLKNYPLQEIKGINLRYGRDNGKIIIERATKQKNACGISEQDFVYNPVSSLYGIVARLRYIDKENSFGLRINIEDFNGCVTSIDVERSFLVKASGNELKSELLSKGLRLYPDGDKTVIATLKAASPDREILITTKPGLFQLDSHDTFAFVTPDGRSYSDTNQDVELSLNERISPPYSLGTFESWQEAIRTAATAPGCPHFSFGVMTAFVGPILSIVRLDTCGINLSGFTSKGKSTAQRLAASVWSTPKLGCGLFQSMRTTDNAVELLATKANGTVLLLDDIALIDGRDLESMIYSLSSGSSKSRMTQQFAMQSKQTWTTFALLSGEKSLEEKIKSAGGTWQAGMSVRFPDVDVTDVNEKLSNEIMQSINSIAENYGHAGHKFIKAIFDNDIHHNFSELKGAIITAARTLANSEESQLIRAAIPFALVQIAGELAKKFGVLPMEIEPIKVVTWAYNNYLASSNASILNPKIQIIENIQSWIAARWDVTIKNISNDDRLNNREAVGWYDNESVYIPSNTIVEAGGNIAKKEFISGILIKQGLLYKRASEKQATINYVRGVGGGKFYALDRHKLQLRTSMQDPTQPEADDD